jgi:DNA mismatch repair protein MutS
MGHEMIDEYFNIYTDKVSEFGEKTCVLYACGSFYEVYGVNNEEEQIGNVDQVADNLHIICSKKNKSVEGNSRSNPKFCGFTTSYLPKYLPMLLENGYTVIIVDQLEESSNKKGKLVERGITAIHSPCLQPPDLETCDTNNLMNILIEILDGHSNKNKKGHISPLIISSYCCINNSNNEIELSENIIKFPNDKIEQNLDEINRVIYKYNPKQINLRVISKNENYATSIKKFFKNNFLNILKIQDIDEIEFKKYSKVSFQDQYFKNVYKHINFGLLQSLEFLNIDKMPLTIINFMYSLDFMAKHDLKYITNLNIPKIINDSDILLLELNTLIQLDIVSNKKEQPLTLFDVINNTSTSIGKRYLKHLLCNPFKKIIVIESRYKLSDILEQAGILDQIEKILNGILDFERLHRKMALGLLHPFEFVKLHETYIKILNLVEIINNSKDGKTLINLFYPTFQDIDILVSFMDDSRNTFNFEEMKSFSLITNKDIISNYFYPNVINELDVIQNKILRIENDIEELRKKYDDKIQRSNQDQMIKLGFTDQEGYYFTCTKIRYQNLLKQLSKDEIAKISLRQTSGACKIFIDELSKLSKELISNRELLNKNVKLHYLSKMDEYYTKYNNVFNSLVRFIELLDVIKSNLKCKIKYNYCRPIIEMADQSFIEATDIRHPIIERLNVEYIPNDIILNSENQGILLYGINSCGKSSLLRAIGINIILAQSGLYVPCKSFKYYPFDNIISQVDLSDNISLGRSSYINEMYGLKKILTCSGKNTLILADETCKGTETNSSTALVSAVIMKLIENNSKFFFTTHLHELPKIKQINELDTLQICHLSVSIKNDICIFERKIKPTSGSDLYGLEIAKNILNDDDLIDNAFKIRNIITKNKTNVLTLKKSHYNSNKIMNHCEICNSKEFLETHHINFQSNCDKNGFVKDKYFHKNELYNLACLCKKCHSNITYGKIVCRGYKIGSNGQFLDYEILS